MLYSVAEKWNIHQGYSDDSFNHLLYMYMPLPICLQTLLQVAFYSKYPKWWSHSAAHLEVPH